MSVATISPQDVHSTRSQGRPCLLLDVRTPGEHAGMHVPGVHLLPLDALDPAAVARLRQGDEPVYVLCRSGGRAAKAVEKLCSAGLAQCFAVAGGTEGWAAAGLPVNRGKGVISLERQVRITAGLLVVTGVALGLLVHPGFFGLSGFVGAGLMFAGITDWCGMGLLLARMPWNQRGIASAAGTCPKP